MFNNIKPIILGGLICLAFASCKKDVVETPVPPTDGENVTAKAAGTSEDAYYPYQNGSTYTYVDSTANGSASTSKSVIAISGDTTIDGKQFSKSSNGTAFHNNTAGETTLVSYRGSNKITTTLLKANEPVGATWKDVFTNNGVPNTYEWKMIAKGLEKTVGGITYKNVIQVHLSGYAEIKGRGKVVFADSDYFYAPNVGLIENIAYDPSTGKTEMHRQLQKKSAQ